MPVTQHKFFQAFLPDDVEKLKKHVEIMNLEDGEELFPEGAPSDAVYLVLDGHIELIKVGSDKSIRVIAVSLAGEYFGEMGVFDGSPRSTGARAGGRTKLARIGSGPLLETIHSSPARSAMMAFVHTLLSHIRLSNERYMNDIVRREKVFLVGQMAATIIHDIRGPFQAIQLASEMLLEQHHDPDTRETCHLISAQINSVSVMADELLEFSRGASKLTLVKMDLASVFDEFRFLNQDILQKSRVPVVFDIQMVPVAVDRHKLIRTIQNIVNNALDALKGRPDARISIFAGPVAGQAEIRITDNAGGIPEAIREKLFEPFVTHGKQNGTGLGMAIVKSVVEAHKGTISFETETGKGTTFFIRIPSGAAA